MLRKNIFIQKFTQTGKPDLICRICQPDDFSQENDMKIIEVLHDAQLVLVDLEVSISNKKKTAPTLCAKYKGKIIPLNTAHDGRPILMKEENAIEF